MIGQIFFFSSSFWGWSPFIHFVENQYSRCSESASVALANLDVARGGEVEDGGILDVRAEVGPQHVGGDSLHAVTGREVSVDGDASVLGNGGFYEDLAAGFVEEGLNTENLSNGVFPFVDVVTWGVLYHDETGRSKGEMGKIELS